jgi:pre-rRNA-processing protein TSR3
VRFLAIQHHKENHKKCTLTPLRNRPDVEIEVLRPGPGGYPQFWIEGGILLAVGAPPLERSDRAILDADPRNRVVLIDGNWIKVPGILRVLRARGPLVHRSLPEGIRTAYPRRSKIFVDPEGGLATVEAMAAAGAILGSPDPELLAGYTWREEFLKLNASLFGASAAVVE